jgi:hypothetical protein
MNLLLWLSNIFWLCGSTTVQAGSRTLHLTLHTSNKVDLDDGDMRTISGSTWCQDGTYIVLCSCCPLLALLVALSERFDTFST